MPILRSLTIKNIGPVKSIYLPLDLPGVTTIRGQNLDSRTENDSNGVGKTLLFSAIPNVVYFEPPVSVKKKSAKSFLGDKGSVTLTLENAKVKHTITQRAKGSTVKYDLAENDVSQKVHRTGSAQDDIRELFPLTMEQYYCTTHLNALSNNKLLVGKGTERMDLFENLFPLDIYEQMQERTKAQYDVAKKAQASHSILQGELDAMDAPEDTAVLEKQQRKFDRILTSLREKNDNLVRDITQVENAVRLTARIKGKDVPDLQECRLRVTSRKERLASLRERQRAAIRLSEQWEEYQRSRKRRKALSEKLDALPKVAKIKGDDESDREEMRALRAKLDLHDANEKGLKRLTGLDLKAEIAGRQLDKDDPFGSAKRRQDDASAELRSLRKHIATHESGKGTCEACGSKLKVSGDALYVMRKRLKTLQALIDSLEELLSHEKAHKVKQELGKFDYESANEAYEEIRKRVVARKDSRASREERDRLEAALEQLKVAKPKSEAPDLDDFDRKIGEAEEFLDAARETLKLAEALEEAGISTKDIPRLTAKHEELIAERQEVGERIRSISQKLAAVESRLAVAKSVEDRRLDLQNRIEDIAKISRRFPVLSILADAYGPRGLKIDAIHGMAEEYIKNLNEVSGEFFNKPFRFHVDVNGRELSILAERNGDITDVRLISGFEGRAFSMASVVSILPLLPSRQQTNLLILDEMETCLSPPNREHLMTDLIPRVAQFIPSVYVITALPPQEFHVPDSRELKMVLRNSTSTLEGL